MQFRTIEEFEFALAGRTEFPAAHLPALAERSPEALERVAAHLWAVERRLRDLLTRTPEKAGSLGEELREVELRHFSQDHRWRDLAAALALLGPAYDPYREIALVRYLQYLASRQEALRRVMMAKQGHLEGSPAAVPGMLETALLEDDRPGRAGDEEAAVAAAFGELPPGESLVLSLDESGRLMLELSHHPFLLRREPAGLVLEDPVGRRATLGPGPNLVGRHPGSDVVVEGGYRSVSRRHLVLEPMPPDQVRITDLSAHGTSVPAAVLAKALASS